MFFDHYDGMNVLEAIGNYLQGVKKDVNATQRKKKTIWGNKFNVWFVETLI